MDKKEILKKFNDLGLHIIRLKPDDKRPAEKWGEAPKHTLKELYDYSEYGANFGAVLGDKSNGIVVIDLDQAQLYHQYFKDVDTLVVKTPKKGYHIYLQTEKDQRKIPSYLFKPIDLQANKSYVVIPPSSINGNNYEIIKDRPIKHVKDPEVFLRDRLSDIVFKKSVDCIDLAERELGKPVVDSSNYVQYLCPFHNDTDTPSLTVYEDGFKCFGCGWHGDAQSFLLKLGKQADEVFEYLDEHGVDLTDDELKLQTKRQKQLQLLTEMIKQKYPLCTDAVTSKAYVYFPPKNIWREIQSDGFFKQLVFETTGHPVLDDEVDIIVQYIFNPIREDSDWVAFDNGLVNVETGEFVDPTDEIFTTCHIKYNYNEEAYSGFFEDSLREILVDDKDGDSKLDFFYEMVGYFFTGHNGYNKMFFLTGSGANGKSTLMAIIRKIFEGYTTSQQLQELHKDFGLQPLIGKKINIVYDLSNRALTDIGTLKAITGEDEVTINIKNAPQVSMKLPTKIIATGNVLPEITEQTYAFYRRVVHLELTNTFKNPDVNIIRKLLEDKEGMEAFIFKAINSYQKVKERGWSIDESIESVTDSYKKLSDPIGWATDRLFEIGDDDDYITSDSIYSSIKKELEDNGVAIPKRSQKYFKNIKEDIGAESIRKNIEGRQVRVWVGVKYKHIPKGMAKMMGLDDYGDI